MSRSTTDAMQPGEPAASAQASLADLPRWVSMGGPLLLALGYGAAAIVGEGAFSRVTAKEGPVEWATFVILLGGVAAGVAALLWRRRMPVVWLGPWLAIYTLGLVYFAGEEVSWGQHIFGWETPEALRGLNVQDETNIHNMSRLLGRVPRTLIEIWTVFACIVVPLWLRRRPPLDPRRDAGYWFWPTTACVVAAVLAQAVYLPSRIAEVGGFKMPASVGCSETQEMFLAAVLSLYVASIAYRARQMGGPG